MKKYILLLISLLIYLNYSFAIVKWVKNIFDIDLKQYSCDEIISDRIYYLPWKWEYKVYWYDFENDSNKALYFWQWRTEIINWSDLVNINFSEITKKNLSGDVLWSWIDLFVFNYPYLCKNWFKISPWDKVRLLTTSEEVGTYQCGNYVYDTKFTLWTWNYWLWVVSEWVLPSNFTFNIPTIGVKSIWGNNLVSFRLGILYDEDNDLNTTWDNKLKISCYDTQILYCWDGIVSIEYWEECDPEDPNDDWTCKINCKKECVVSEDDIDWDCVPNDIDLAPQIPEDFDWYQDQDWIPDFDLNIPNNNIIENLNCNICPCPFAWLNSALWNQDKIKASLWWYKFNIPYIWSIERIFEGYPK